MRGEVPAVGRDGELAAVPGQLTQAVVNTYEASALTTEANDIKRGVELGETSLRTSVQLDEQ